jgi:hypothetical protein
MLSDAPPPGATTRMTLKNKVTKEESRTNG